MGIVSTTTFSSDTETVTKTKLNGLAANLLSEFNGSIDNTNIKALAAIAASKLNLATVAQPVQMSAARLGMAQGAAVVSATALTLGTDGNVFHVTGTTTITSITVLSAPALIVLIFDGILTLTDGNNIKIAGNFVTTADDSITLWFDGTNYWEMARAVN